MRWLAGLCGALLVAGTAAAQGFDTDSVIALHRAGLGDTAIIAKIKASPCGYDTSTDRLIALKRAGIDESVIVAMVERCAGATRTAGSDAGSADPLQRHQPGIYLAQDGRGGPRLTILRPTAIVGTKITGNGSLLFPHMAKATVPQASAQLAVPTGTPTFYFYFAPDDPKVSSFGTFATRAVQSPNEFSLVRFRVVGSNREFVVGKVVPYVQTAGVDPKATLPFTVSELGEGIFKVEVSQSLLPGQYGFVLAGEKGFYRIFDFTVSPPPGK